MPIVINYTAEFKQNVKRLNRRYRFIKDDLQELLEQLKQGSTPGDKIQGIGYTVYKVRVKNTDIKKGKSGGYRVIYYVRSDSGITLLAMYSKSDQANISTDTLRRILGNHSAQ